MSEVIASEEERLAAARMEAANAAETAVADSSVPDAARLDEAETRQANAAPEATATAVGATEGPTASPEAAQTTEMAPNPEAEARAKAEAEDEKKKKERDAKELSTKASDLKTLVINAFQVPDGLNEAEAEKFVAINLVTVEKQITAIPRLKDYGITTEWLGQVKSNIELFNGGEAEIHRYETWPSSEIPEEQQQLAQFKSRVELQCLRLIVKGMDPEATAAWVRKIGDRLQSKDATTKQDTKELLNTESEELTSQIDIDIAEFSIENAMSGAELKQFAASLPDFSSYQINADTIPHKWLTQDETSGTILSPENYAKIIWTTYIEANQDQQEFVDSLSTYFQIPPEQKDQFIELATAAFEAATASFENAIEDEEDDYVPEQSGSEKYSMEELAALSTEMSNTGLSKSENEAPKTEGSVDNSTQSAIHGATQDAQKAQQKIRLNG